MIYWRYCNIECLWTAVMERIMWRRYSTAPLIPKLVDSIQWMWYAAGRSFPVSLKRFCLPISGQSAWFFLLTGIKIIKVCYPLQSNWTLPSLTDCSITLRLHCQDIRMEVNSKSFLNLALGVVWVVSFMPWPFINWMPGWMSTTSRLDVVENR